MRRVALLAIGAAVTGGAAGFLALWANLQALPAADLAHGMSLLTALGDPFVRAVWLAVTIASSLMGFAISLWALWNVRLAKAGPTVAVVTIVAAASVAFVNPLLSPPVALVAAAATMLYCRSRAGWAEADGTGGPRNGHAA